MTIVDFILARIAEWEAEAREAIDERARTPFSRPETATEPDYSLQAWPDVGVPAVLVGPELVLRQCETFRGIVERHGMGPHDCPGPARVTHYSDDWPCGTLLYVASVWADHPNYQPEWKP